MTIPEILQLVSVACAIVAAGCAILAARRAGRWRDSDAAQQLLTRVGAVETKAKENAAAIRAVERETTLKFDAIKDEIDGLATKADAAKLQGAIDRVCAIADRTEQTVNRVNDFLMHERKA